MKTHECVTTGRRGLLAAADEIPMNALTMGLSVGCGIAVAMALPFAIGDLAAGTQLLDARVILGCIVTGLGTGLLQQVFFNPRVLGPGLAYPSRTALFGLCDLVVLVSSAWFGNWVPKDMPQAWAVFVVAYLAILAVLTLALGKAYSAQEDGYAKRLAAYRREHESENR